MRCLLKETFWPKGETANYASFRSSNPQCEQDFVGLTYLRHSQTFDRAARAFNTARRGYTQTLKELEALQSNRKAEEAEAARESAEPDPEPEQSKQLEPKLVSFRQPEAQPQPEPEPLAKTAEQGAEIPPIAA